MKHALHSILTAAFLLPATLAANTAPTVVIQSAAMRPGTTLMDVVYRVNDPDDATVKTRALAFVDGVRSFAKVIKPVTFVEGTAAKLGDAIPSNTNHTLTWDVGADWNIDLGQVKFEVLAMDGRGVLPVDWITIPAAGGKPAFTISNNSPTDAEVLNSLFWQYADGDLGLSLGKGTLSGNSNSGVFEGIKLVHGTTLQAYSTPFIFKRMNLDPDNGMLAAAAMAARAGLSTPQGWHAVNRSYAGFSKVVSWGNRWGLSSGQELLGIIGISVGDRHSLALKGDGTVIEFDGNDQVPDGLHGVTAIAAGSNRYSLALKSDGTVVDWGFGFSFIPAELSGITAIAAGGDGSSPHGLALKNNGTVVGWGSDSDGQTTIPAGLSGVTAVAAGRRHSLARRSNGTVVGWGSNSYGQTTIPTLLSGVIAIAAGGDHSLALKSNGTVVGWGNNSYRQSTIPTGLSGVIAIAAGGDHSLALKSNGTVVGWGFNFAGQRTIPAGLSGVIAIAVGEHSSHAIKAKTP
jgi:alpha-tubulin suppressor-like RCC1 family protein